MHRRHVLIATALSPLALAAQAKETFEVTRTTAEWKAMLTDAEYRVMRLEGTERAFSSPLDKEYRDGEYFCRGCGLHIYRSKWKYDSGTGWPSFFRAVRGSVGTKTDYKLIYPRTEVHCRRCGSHLGHIFNDGPKPTGKRHCLNGVSLIFKPA